MTSTYVMPFLPVKGRDHMGNLGVNGRIILNRIAEKKSDYEEVRNKLAGSGENSKAEFLDTVMNLRCP
jgi:hypothetical protein